MIEKNNEELSTFEETINNTIEESDTEKSETMSKISKCLDDLEDCINVIVKQSRSSWIRGFITGSSSVFAGLAIGNVIVKRIDQRG
jgi:hypothetical protein